MTRITSLLLSILLSTTVIVTPAYAGEDHDHEETKKTVIHAENAKNNRIQTAVAGPATINETLHLNGYIAPDQTRLAHVSARYPGLIRKVSTQIGERVEKGQTLAMVESNDSLQTYAITAPLEGVVTEHNAHIGDNTDDAPLFVISDLHHLWAELYVFSRDLTRMAVGQSVELLNENGTPANAGTVVSLFPTADATSQSVIARVAFDNTSSLWRSGMRVQANVILNTVSVPVAVRQAALQRDAGHDVVFVQDGDTYTARPVKIGKRDSVWTEIQSGLKAGETYVVKNSFVVKADIEKSEAEHAH